MDVEVERKHIKGQIDVDVRSNGRVFTIEITLPTDADAAQMLSDVSDQLKEKRQLHVLLVCGPNCRITAGRVQ